MQNTCKVTLRMCELQGAFTFYFFSWLKWICTLCFLSQALWNKKFSILYLCQSYSPQIQTITTFGVSWPGWKLILLLSVPALCPFPVIQEGSFLSQMETTIRLIYLPHKSNMTDLMFCLSHQLRLRKLSSAMSWFFPHYMKWIFLRLKNNNFKYYCEIFQFREDCSFGQLWEKWERQCFLLFCLLFCCLVFFFKMDSKPQIFHSLHLPFAFSHLCQQKG